MNKKAETKQTKKAKIVKAARERGANEFGQTSKVHAPFKGVSTSRPSNIVNPKIKWRTVAEKPDWKEWRYTPQVRVWQACALSLDIEPYSIKPNPNSHLTGPYMDQLFEAESFQSENEKKEFKSRQRILLNNLNSKENSLCFSPNPNRPNLGEVSLSEFAAWCPSVEWSIPKELAVLAKKPELATVGKVETTAPVPLDDKEEKLEEDEEETWEQEGSEPFLRKGLNKREKVDSWVKWQAKYMLDHDTVELREGRREPIRDDFAEAIYLLAEKRGYQSNKGTLSKETTLKMLQPGITGGRKGNAANMKNK